MAKVKITGHASGSGVITVTAPNTSTDRTITLPDATATIATTTDVAARLPSITDGGNATAITIDSSEKIIIGDATSHTTDLLQIETPASGGGHGIQIRRNDTNTGQGIGHILFGNNTATDLAKIAAGTDGAADSGYLILATQPASGNLTDRLTITSDGRGLSQFTAKAWVNFDQTGTAAINDSHNVSGMTDIGTGKTQITFANAMGNNNYCQVNGMGDYERIYNEGAALATKHTNSRKSTGSTYIDLATGTNATDFDEVNILVFGD